jgi:hypothetical protein
MADTLGELLAYVAKASREQPDAVLRVVEHDEPDFPDSDYLARELLALWPRLPVAARLVAFLMALDKSDCAASRWERFTNTRRDCFASLRGPSSPQRW